MKKPFRVGKNFWHLPKTDNILSSIIDEPHVDAPLAGYSALEKEVNVHIAAPNIKMEIRNVEGVAQGQYRGKVSVDYLKELAYREDIEMIYSIPRGK